MESSISCYILYHLSEINLQEGLNVCVMIVNVCDELLHPGKIRHYQILPQSPKICTNLRKLYENHSKGFGNGFEMFQAHRVEISLDGMGPGS